MELAKIRNLSDEELTHQEKTSAEQLFRLRFQVSLGQNDGVKKLRQLRKEIAQIKTVARERELGIHGEAKEAKPAAKQRQPRQRATKTAKAKKAAAPRRGEEGAEGEESRCGSRGEEDSESEGSPQMTATQTERRRRRHGDTRRNEKVGQVVSTKMQKTIVVAVEMRKAHAKYKRIVRSTKKFYAHDEQSSARMGDMVRIRETRPLSKLKRWSLEEIVRRSALSQIEDAVLPGEAVPAEK